MKVNIYLIVFGIIAAIIIVAGLSTFVFNKNLTPKPTQLALANLTTYGPAPNIQGIAYWINSQPLNITQLKGKVVLVDFWTYSCINCIRTIPYLDAWQKEYGNNGLVIIGVSTPEFEFEHNYTNVKNAVEKFNITYPVAMDNNYSTWTAYNNEYWPADYVINASGIIKYETFGEGGYAQTQTVIQELLEQAGYKVNTTIVNLTGTPNFSGIGSPELYVGWQRARAPIGNPQGFSPNKTVNYTKPNITQVNEVYFSGPWYNAPDGMIAESNASKLYLVYKAEKVNVVASGNATINIELDNKTLNQSYYGADVKDINGKPTVIVNSSRLYNIVDGPNYNPHLVEINANTGFKIYTFTFG